MKQIVPMIAPKLCLNALLFATAAAVLITDLGAAEKPADPDIALKPAHIIVKPWRNHIPPTKRQGVPGIERTAKGRLWAVYGRDVESTRNYQVLTRSDDDGKSWSDAQLMILPRRGVRAMSATDWIDGSWTPEDTIVLARSLKDLGCDYIAVSSGGLSLDQDIPLGEGHQVPLASKIRAASGLPVMAMGMIHDPNHANRVIANGDADMIALARAFLSDPHWPWHAAAVLGQEVDYPPQYLRGYRSGWLRERRAHSSQDRDQP